MLQHRILVTGSGGQLGGAPCRLFGRAVGLDAAELDITNRQAVLAALDRHRPAAVINAAAYTRVDRAEAEPERCRAVNLRGVENLLAACRAFGSAIVQISTDYVFDGRQTTPYVETDTPRPLNAYGQAKWEAEQAVAQYPRHLVVRTAGLFGSGGPTSAGNFVDTMLRIARQKQPIRVVGDQITCFTHTADLAAAIKSLLDAGAAGCYHLTNTGYASWHDFAVEIFRLADLQPRLERIRLQEYPSAARRPPYSVLSTKKYAAIPGTYPMPTWQHAVADYLESKRGRS